MQKHDIEKNILNSLMMEIFSFLENSLSQKVDEVVENNEPQIFIPAVLTCVLELSIPLLVKILININKEGRKKAYKNLNMLLEKRVEIDIKKYRKLSQH